MGIFSDYYNPQGVPDRTNKNTPLSDAVSAYFEAQDRKRKIQKEKLDMYITLRDNGYDEKAARDAVESGRLPSIPGTGTSTNKQLKEQLDLANSQLGLQKTQLDIEKGQQQLEGLKLKQEQDKAVQEKKVENLRVQAQDMLDTISETEKGLGAKWGFGIGSLAPVIPGTEQATWHANVDKLLSANVLRLMNEMKQASRTGATGFGQLNREELKTLQNASTALKKTLSSEAARKILNDMKPLLEKALGVNASKVNETSQYQSGETRIVNGITYQRQEDGKWLRIK